jgi:Zn-dependent protease
MQLALCADCKAPLDPTALACPSCRALTHAAEIESLATQAQQAQARRDFVAARALWEQAAALLPPETVQYSSIRARIAAIDKILADPAQASHSKSKWGSAAGAGSVLLALLAKGKFLLFGLTKLGTILSMLAFAGVYWGIYGWKLAVLFVLSIYIHEMGHVIELHKYGIPASAPMFIPGFGAFISMRGHSITRVQDNRVGLAGPIYGLGAAIAALLIGHALGSKLWIACAHLTAAINLFNLIPIWQLDGSRGFASLTRQQRAIVLAVAAALWWITRQEMLMLIALVATYRLFSKDYAPEPDRTGLLQFLGLLGALTLVIVLAQFAAQ